MYLHRTTLRPAITALTLLATPFILCPLAQAGFLPTAGGTYDYNNTANWSSSTINNQWTSTLSGNQLITFGADTTLSSSMQINYGGIFDLTFVGTGGNRTLTMGGNLSTTSASSPTTITFGSTTEGQKLNIELGSSTRTIGTSTNRTLTFLNVISGTGGITQTGSGTLQLKGLNTFTGAVSVQSGATMEVTKLADAGQASNIGAGLLSSSSRIVFSGGTLKYLGAGDSTNHKILIGSAGAIFDSSGTGAVQFTNTSSPDVSPSAGQARTVTLKGTNTDDNALFAAVTNSGSGATSFTKEGSGTWLLSGDNTATGDITITQGRLAIGAANRLADTARLVMNGGTFATRGFSETLGTVSLGANSTIDLGSGTSALVFADSSAETWGASFSLSFVNFTNGVDTIRFGTNQNGLTLTQLSQITINGSGAAIDGSGFLSLATIPEPSSYALLAGAAGLLVVGLRRRQVR